MLMQSSKQISPVAQAKPALYTTILGVAVAVGFCSVGLKALCNPYVEVRHITQVTVQHLRGENYQQNLFNAAIEAANNGAALRAVTERELLNVIGALEHAEHYQILNSSLPHGYSGEDYRMNYGDSVVPPANNAEGYQAHEKALNTARTTVIPPNNEGATGPAAKLKDDESTSQQIVGNRVRDQEDRPNSTRPARPIAQFAVQYPKGSAIPEAGKVAGPGLDTRPSEL
jgi:hypothetical protein